MRAHPLRCEEHPAYDADYCPLCGTAAVIGQQPADWFDRAYMGRLVDVVERKGRFSRTGVAFRGWYADGQRLVKVQVRTAREADSYAVTDLADNWEVQA